MEDENCKTYKNNFCSEKCRDLFLEMFGGKDNGEKAINPNWFVGCDMAEGNSYSSKIIVQKTSEEEEYGKDKEEKIISHEKENEL